MLVKKSRRFIVIIVVVTEPNDDDKTNIKNIFILWIQTSLLKAAYKLRGGERKIGMRWLGFQPLIWTFQMFAIDFNYRPQPPSFLFVVFFTLIHYLLIIVVVTVDVFIVCANIFWTYFF